MLSAADLYERAVTHSNAGRHALAVRALIAAASRAAGPDLAARIEGTLAYLESETGDAEAALRRCRAALAAPELTDHTRAVLTSQLGLIELRRGDLAAALPHLDDAIDRLGDDPARVGRILLNRGLVHLEGGDIRQSEADFASAAVAFDAVGDRVESAKAQHNQGYAALLRGDLIGALRLMDAARTVLAAESPVFLAVCDLDRAEVLRAAGMTADAAALIASAARSFGLRRLRQMQADAEYTLATTLLDSDPTGAATVARAAARRYRRRGNETAAIRADATAIAGAIQAGHHGPDLIRRADACRRELVARRLHSEAITLALHATRFDVRASRFAAADRTARRVRASSPELPIATRLLAREVAVDTAEARAAEPSGVAAAASGVTTHRRSVLAEARAGLDELAEWQSSFGTIDLLSSTAVRGRRLALAGIRAAVATGDPEIVFEWSERTRSLANRILPVRPPSDPATAAMLSELRRLRTGEADDAREAELIRSIRHRGWVGSSGGAVAEVPALDDVRADILDSGGELVCYLWTESGLVALVVGEATTLVDLGQWRPVAELLTGLLADLDMAAAELPAGFAASVQASLDDRLSRLDALLVRPLRERLRGGRLMVSAPGVLGGVPWGMLPSLGARALTLPASVGRWRESGRAPQHPSRVGLVAGPRVARAAHEVTSAASNWADPDTLLGEASTVQATARLAEHVDLLHISAHGRHSAENPLFSGLELVDGPWFGFDVDRLQRVPQVVVLSACESGRSATGWGRESIGTAQAWLHAGARCVIAAPASVNDAHASELLTMVHARLASGAVPADALAAAISSVGRESVFQVYGRGW